MSALSTFFRLSAQDQKLVIYAIVALVHSRARLRTQSIERLQVWAALPGNGKIPAPRIAWAVKTASRRIPGATCLSQALALQHLLSKNGHRSELRIGVDRAEGQFAAHAWLALDDRVLIGEVLTLEQYKLLARWPQPRDLAAREVERNGST